MTPFVHEKCVNNTIGFSALNALGKAQSTFLVPTVGRRFSRDLLIMRDDVRIPFSSDVPTHLLQYNETRAARKVYQTECKAFLVKAAPAMILYHCCGPTIK